MGAGDDQRLVQLERASIASHGIGLLKRDSIRKKWFGRLEVEAG